MVQEIRWNSWTQLSTLRKPEKILQDTSDRYLTFGEIWKSSKHTFQKDQNKERKQQQKTLKKMGSIIATQIQWNFPLANLDNVQVDIGR